MSESINSSALIKHSKCFEALQRLGFEDFIGSQWSCIEPVLNGHDVLALLPTGAGKSTIYQVASLVREGVGIVVSPLISIMQQQVEQLSALGIKAEFLNSTQNGAEQNDLHWRLRRNDVEILYMSPEKLLQPSVLGLLEDIPIACIAVDEAHCVLRWGKHFRPEYDQLGQLKDVFPSVPVIALTGTLLRSKEEEVEQALDLSGPVVVRESIKRPNLRIQVSQKRRAKHQLLSFLMKEGLGLPGIVYCRSRRKTEELASWLTENGVAARCYHASLDHETRTQAHTAFAQGGVQVLVATTAYGMGIDLGHVRFVVHLDLPLSIESYVQEMGRAGRDGRPAFTLLFYGLQDILQTWQFLQHERGDESDFWQLIECLETLGCRQDAVLRVFNEAGDERCGQCDRCIKPVSQHNVTIAAQKILSLVHKTKGIVPFSSLIHTLLGKNNKSVSNYSLQQSNLFGEGKSLDESQWKAVIRRLLAAGYLRIQQIQPFRVCLDESCRAILKGDNQLILSPDFYYPVLRESDCMPSPDDQSWNRLMRWSVQNRMHEHLSDVQLHKVYEANPKSYAALSRVTGLSVERLKRLNAAELFGDLEYG